VTGPFSRLKTLTAVTFRCDSAVTLCCERGDKMLRFR